MLKPTILMIQLNKILIKPITYILGLEILFDNEQTVAPIA